MANTPHHPSPPKPPPRSLSALSQDSLAPKVSLPRTRETSWQNFQDASKFLMGFGRLHPISHPRGRRPDFWYNVAFPLVSLGLEEAGQNARTSYSGQTDTSLFTEELQAATTVCLGGPLNPLELSVWRGAVMLVGKEPLSFGSKSGGAVRPGG